MQNDFNLTQIKTLHLEASNKIFC